MFLKKREVPLQLKCLRALEPRMTLPLKFQKQLKRSEEGIVGEIDLDKDFQESDWNAYVIPDLRWEMGGSSIQIDTVAIAQGTVHVFEAKNWSGDCYFEENRFYYPNDFEVKNPLYQARNNALAIRQVLRHWRSNYTVKHWLLFMNPAFNLRQAKITDPIIMPNQIERHLAELSRSAPSTTPADKALAMRLLQLHDPTEEEKHLLLPNYSSGSLAKGMVCQKCRSLTMRVTARTSICSRCGEVETIYTNIRHAADDFRTLFPEERLTAKRIRTFCNNLVSQRAVRTTLMKDFELIRKGRSSYYR